VRAKFREKYQFAMRYPGCHRRFQAVTKQANAALRRHCQGRGCDSVLQNHVGAFFADHHRRGIGIA
jgi:hypothetical protein